MDILGFFDIDTGNDSGTDSITVCIDSADVSTVHKAFRLTEPRLVTLEWAMRIVNHKIIEPYVLQNQVLKKSKGACKKTQAPVVPVVYRLRKRQVPNRTNSICSKKQTKMLKNANKK